MKTLYFSLAALFFVALMSSCSMIERSGFSKQKYTNYKRSNPDNPKLKSEIAHKPVVVDMGPVSTISEKPVTFNDLVVNDKSYTSYKDAESFKHITNPLPVTVNHNTPVTIDKSNIKSMFRGGGFAANAESDVDLVVLVILAILLPPLAVYLKEGSGNHFLIVLILFLLAFSWFLWPFYPGLFWLAAVILALLSVLGKW